MTLHKVDLIRQRVAHGLRNEIVRIRAYISFTDGNAEAVEMLRGPGGDQLIAELTQHVLLHLGHVPEAKATRGAPSETPGGKGLRRATKGLAGA